MLKISNDQGSQTFCRLIEQEKFRAVHQCSADRKHLLLTAAQISSPARLDFSQCGEEVIDALSGPLVVPAEWNFQVIIDREVRKDTPVIGHESKPLTDEEKGFLTRNLLGFLIRNRPPARVFLGNCGSQPISLLLSLLVLLSTTQGPPGRVAAPPIASAWPMLLPLIWPLFDLVFVTISRLGRGRAPWVGGSDHTTHLLSRRLGSDRKAAFILLLYTVIALAGVVVLRNRP